MIELEGVRTTCFCPSGRASKSRTKLATAYVARRDASGAVASFVRRRRSRAMMMAAYARRSLCCLRAGSRQSGWQARALAAAADELFSVKRSGPRAESLEAGRMPQNFTSVDDQVTLEAKARAHTLMIVSIH